MRNGMVMNVINIDFSLIRVGEHGRYICMLERLIMKTIIRYPFFFFKIKFILYFCNEEDLQPLSFQIASEMHLIKQGKKKKRKKSATSLEKIIINYYTFSQTKSSSNHLIVLPLVKTYQPILKHIFLSYIFLLPLQEQLTKRMVFQYWSFKLIFLVQISNLSYTTKNLLYLWLI